MSQPESIGERISVRRARTSDVPAIRRLLDTYAEERVLLSKATVTLYEDVQEFWIAEGPAMADPIVGCGALHVMWEDLAEVRTLAVDPAVRGRGVGHLLVEQLIRTARELAVAKLFCLTFEVDFFRRHGFDVVEGSPVTPEVFSALLQSYDEGVAEFLDLDRVKPNTLGNTRMLRRL